ncbi:hypothetical protein K6L44_12530 [Gluconacetobacter entanii]|uniref:hypothetical protein n=1 Tax=Gluconacetobacter entanii TaxID=108528 RepID=UPI001C9345C0|nr:hypothetical protein [Gluconacetobacter entanii]MBY4640794.1 hypothetical protein [Gluconacetobacter entanii]MCW4581181.1 hypothetical protein [Gluconacetobacter entanii]MCW4584441.1 hypothetical protein [Gluconacetobacter entanii]MCW4587895.1 hypothetical protein [Gluconacetobacter entanii]
MQAPRRLELVGGGARMAHVRNTEQGAESMQAVSITGAQGTTVSIATDSTFTNTLAQQYAQQVTATLSSDTMVAGTPGTDQSSAARTFVDITSGGTYTLDGSDTGIVIGGLNGQSLSQAVSVNATGVTTPVNVIAGDLGGVTYTAGSESGVFTAASGNNVFSGGSGDYVINTGAGRDTISTGTGQDTINAGIGAAAIYLAAANNTLDLQGADTVYGADRAAQDVTLETRSSVSGSASLDLGAKSHVTDTGSGNSMTVHGGSTITGGTDDSVTLMNQQGLYGLEDLLEAQTMNSEAGDTISATGFVTINDPTGGDVSVDGCLRFLNARGTATVSAWRSTIYGAAGTDDLNITASDDTYTDFDGSQGSGNEVFDGANSTGDIDAVGGSGNNTLIGGSGNNTLSGANGINDFIFINGHAGGQDIIKDFGKSSANVVELSGYNMTQASLQDMLANATVTGGNTTISLSDHTRVTFVGVTDLGAQNFKA